MSESSQGPSGLVIDGMSIYPFDIPLKEVFTFATMSYAITRNLLVELRTNQGITGWGEASSFRSIVGETQLINIAAARELKPLLLGKNPLAIHDRLRELDAHLAHNTTLKSAIDLALHDIAAKACGVPLYAYLGGQPRAMETDLTIGIGDPARAGEKAARIQSLGFRVIKVKLGLDAGEDLRRMRNIRGAVGSGMTLRIDANQGWDRVSAVRNLKAYEELDVEFCEQPCRAQDLDGMRQVCRSSAIPNMADESVFSPTDALELIRQEAADYFNIKLSKAGGIDRARKIASVAEAGHRPCMIGCMSESLLGISAAAHFASATAIVRFFDLDSCLEHAENHIVGGITYRGGEITLPEQPGIGAYPDPDYLKTLQALD